MFYVIHWSNVRSWFAGTGTNVCYMEEVKNIEKTKSISENQGSEEEDKVKVLQRYLSVRCVFFLLAYSCASFLFAHERVINMKTTAGMMSLQRCV